MKATYQGSCHCGRVRFEIDAVLTHVRVCDCSMCRHRGALIREGLLLPDMRYSAVQATSSAPGMWSVNVRCLEGVDLDAIRVERLHGSRLA